jgi:hypothetical protein
MGPQPKSRLLIENRHVELVDALWISDHLDLDHTPMSDREGERFRQKSADGVDFDDPRSFKG